MSLRRAAIVTFFAALVGLGWLGLASGQSDAPHALIIRIDGVINSVKERMVDRALDQAVRDDATLVIIELDTPGGFLGTTRAIVESLLESPVPIAVYVSPKGAQAGSAGTFIAAAANFAVMAPGSNIGAATPVSGTGEDLPETLADKVTNDAAAFIRSIAEERGRNPEKLEETVRKASSFTATEAVDLEIADFIAADLDELLAKLDGQTVQTSAGPLTLNTRGLEVVRLGKGPLNHFLEFISNPNIAFLLLTIGILGIGIELFNFGLIVPGVVGVISLLLAFLASGNLPVNWAGVAFIILGVALILLETQVAGWGVLGIGGIVSLVIGGLILFSGFSGFGHPSPTLPPISVSLWVLGGLAGVMAVSLAVLVWLIRTSRNNAPEPEPPAAALLGESGRVTLDLDPRGVVVIGTDSWTAVSENGTVIERGTRVKVVGVHELTLSVAPQPEP